MALGTRAISRIEGASGGGFSNAKKIADLYVATNTNEKGVVSNPAVYDRVVQEILAPYAGTIDGQNLIADYTNKQKKLVAETNKRETTVASLREKEYSSWYVDDDGQDDTSFRNPAWVAQVTSESLDMIVAETVQTITEAELAGEDTNDLNSYLRGLITRSDRMRTVATSLNGGGEANLDGYGYFVDSDPNTGEIRGASFMPTDADFGGITSGKMRTNSMVTVGNKKVPVYTPFVTDENGVKKTTFGGVTYEDDGDVLYADSDREDIALSDRNSYSGVNSKVQLGQLYETFTGRVNVDGSFKKDYMYVGNDNNVYRFADDDPAGQQFLSSMRDVGVNVDSVPRLNPADVAEYSTQPLPSDDGAFAQGQARGAKINRYQQEAAAFQAESDRLNSRGPLEEVKDGFFNLAGKAVNSVKSFFGRKNTPNKPDEASQSVDGQSVGKEVVDSGNSFFRSKVT